MKEYLPGHWEALSGDERRRLEDRLKAFSSAAAELRRAFEADVEPLWASTLEEHR